MLLHFCSTNRCSDNGIQTVPFKIDGIYFSHIEESYFYFCLVHVSEKLIYFFSVKMMTFLYSYRVALLILLFKYYVKSYMYIVYLDTCINMCTFTCISTFRL